MDHTAATRAELATYEHLLRSAVDDPSLLGRAVPACPGWTLHDLTDHLGGVHRWVVTAIREGHGRGASAPAPSDPADLVEWFRSGAEELLAALHGDPKAPAWSFSREPGHRTLGFWQRRQMHENLIHRVDAEQACGLTVHLDAEVAADGIAEVFDVFVPRMRARGVLGDLARPVLLRRSDGPGEWLAGDPGDPVATASGSAADLDLVLWKRAPAGKLTWSGDEVAGTATLAQPLTA